MAIQSSSAPGTPNRPGRARTNDAVAFARHVLIAVGVVVTFVLLFALIWYAADLLMLVFAGVLVSILLRRLRALVRSVTSLGDGLSLTLVVLVLFGVIVAF